MSFFTDPRIRTLTSGTPSQNVDLSGLSFPRRIGVRFHPDYVEREHIVGMLGVWDAYADENFTECLGDKFHHDGLIKRDGWARYAFDGIFPDDVAYIRLELRNARTGLLTHTFYFRFTKAYQRSLDGRTYVKDPVLDQKVVKNGILESMRLVNGKGRIGDETFTNMVVRMNNAGRAEGRYIKMNCVSATSVHYAEKPKFVFLVTPPHLMKYAKLILILLKQLVDVSFDQSYLTKSNQKPLYKTRYMLDELG